MRILRVLLLLASVPLHAQVTQADLQTRLQHKVLYLRGLYEQDGLKFDGTGHLIGKSAQTNPMRSAIRIDKVEIKKDHLALTGKRLMSAFTDHQLGSTPTDETVHINIETPADGNYSLPIDAIFTASLEDLAPTTPEYWLPCLTDTVPPLPAELKNADGSMKLFVAPVALDTPEPRIEEHSASALLKAELTVALVVDTCGNPQGVHLTTHSRDDVDEAVLKAVKGYRFKPATQDGIPATVRLNVSVYVMGGGFSGNHP